MAKNWTPAQCAAMNITNKNLLISAAAGSGKTATLTQRIINKLTDPDHPMDISTMLIVTYTNAAADELKSRIFQAVSEELAKNPSDKYLTDQLIKLGNARICTIDSFCLELIRANFSVLDISPSFRIADPAELELLEITVMEEAIEYFYETVDTFPSLAECLVGTRDSARLSEILLRLANKSNSLPEGIEFLRIHAKETAEQAENGIDFLSTRFGEVLRAETIDTVEHYGKFFDEAYEFVLTPDMEPWLASIQYDRSFNQALLEALRHPTKGYELTRATLASFSPIRFSSLKKGSATEESDRIKAMRADINPKIKKLYEKSFSKSPETLQRAMKDTAHYTDILYRLLYLYESRMEEEKNRRGIKTFHDIRRLAMKLLVKDDGTPTEIARQYSEEFTEIYIDEYQDVDRVQDQIFRSIAKENNRFMVGDIKQSIYGFRGAEPSLFAEYREKFPPHDKATADGSSATVFMSENFRCDKNVIDFTNIVCSRIFYACEKSIGYCPEDDLRFSKALPHDAYVSPKAQVAVLTVPSAKKGPNPSGEEDPPIAKEIEAEYIAGEIERLIRTEKKADGSAILPGDIAVLFRYRSMGPYLSDALNRHGILTSESDGERYFENPDVLLVLSLLNTVDNPHRDIFLTGTLCSPLFGFHMNDIIAIRQMADESYSLYDAMLICKDGESELSARCRAFDEILTEYRSL
ncbi:MAG: UvrD-helicase domain-containing protein, partial [Clostridia bacterium]|nr:UvrD-helicase domain-containing protein [Clostridia bacterium]